MNDIIKIFKPRRFENYIALLIALFLISSFLSYHIPVSISNGLRVTTTAIFVVMIIKNIKGNPIKGFTGFLYSILVFWTFILILRFIIEDIPSFQGVSFNQKLGNIFLSDNFIPYWLPLMLLCFGNNRAIDFRYFINISKQFGKLFLILLPFALYSMLSFKVDMDATTGEDGSYSFDYSEIEALIKKGDVAGAQVKLDDVTDRNGEWHYLQSVIFYKKNWMNESKKQLEIALSLEPHNAKYADDYAKLKQKMEYNERQFKSGNMGNAFENDDAVNRQMGGSGLDSCMSFCATWCCVNTMCNICC